MYERRIQYDDVGSNIVQNVSCVMYSNTKFSKNYLSVTLHIDIVGLIFRCFRGDKIVS